MNDPTPKTPVAPSPILQDLNNLGVPRLSADGMALLRPDGTVFARKCETPTIAPDGGEYAAQNVTLACATDGASIYYTVDGSDPNVDSDLYAAPFAAASGDIVKALAVRPGMLDSEIATSEEFTINGQVATPTFLPVAGAVADGTLITVACATAGAAMFYTTNGAAPTIASTPYVAPVAIHPPQTLKVLATKALFTNSNVGSAAYTLAP